MTHQVRIRNRYRNLKGPWFDYLFVPRDEMREFVAGTGWAVREFIDSDGLEYVAVIEKVEPSAVIGASLIQTPDHGAPSNTSTSPSAGSRA